MTVHEALTAILQWLTREVRLTGRYDVNLSTAYALAQGAGVQLGPNTPSPITNVDALVEAAVAQGEAQGLLERRWNAAWPRVTNAWERVTPEGQVQGEIDGALLTALDQIVAWLGQQAQITGSAWVNVHSDWSLAMDAGIVGAGQLTPASLAVTAAFLGAQRGVIQWQGNGRWPNTVGIQLRV